MKTTVPTLIRLSPSLTLMMLLGCLGMASAEDFTWTPLPEHGWVSFHHAGMDALYADAQAWSALGLEYDPNDQRSGYPGIGYPAIVLPGQPYPHLSVTLPPSAPAQARWEGGIVCDRTGHLVQAVTSVTLHKGVTALIPVTGAPPPGRYRFQFRIRDGVNLLKWDAYYFTVMNPADLADSHSLAAHPGPDGELVYTPDFRGNRLPDFSGSGYRRGADLPNVPMALTLNPAEGDDTARIQAAIDTVSQMEPDTSGFRGALLLTQGVYEISGRLHIRAGGVVLRGEGQGEVKTAWLDPNQQQTLEELKSHLAGRKATILIATGEQRRPLIEIQGPGWMNVEQDSVRKIVDDYVPVGARRFAVEDAGGYQVGDALVIRRHSNDAWIQHIGMEPIGWLGKGHGVIEMIRRIVRIDGNVLTVDDRLTQAIEAQWGGGDIRRIAGDNLIRRSGVEHLRGISFWKPNEDNVDDTRHADQFLVFRNIRDAWVRNVTVEHFFSTFGAIRVRRETMGLTLENSSVLLAPNSFYSGTGYNANTYQPTGVFVGRYGFRLEGQGALVRGGYVRSARHAYAVGGRAAGQNVFTQSEGSGSLTWSEPHQHWSVGGLYDNVKDRIALMNRYSYGSAQGWAGANYVAWNTVGPLIVQQPPTAQNWGIGSVNGGSSVGPFHTQTMAASGYSFGYRESWGTPVAPQSLYAAQLQKKWPEGAQLHIETEPDGSGQSLRELPPGASFRLYAIARDAETGAFLQLVTGAEWSLQTETGGLDSGVMSDDLSVTIHPPLDRPFTIRAQKYGEVGETSVLTRFSMPYQQDFEDPPVGAEPHSFQWRAAPGYDARVREYAYATDERDGGFPLPDSLRQQVLDLPSSGSAVSVDFFQEELNQGAEIYVDTLMYLTPMPQLPPSVWQANDLKAGLYLNPQGHPVLFHGDENGMDNRATTLIDRFTPNTWRRVTLDIHADAVGPRFRLRIDGQVQTSDEGHMWFRFANAESQFAEGTDRTVRQLTFAGKGMVDDVVLSSGGAPAIPPRKLYTMHTQISDGGSLTLEGGTVYEGPASRAFEVYSGDYVSITYTPGAFHEIETLLANGEAVGAATGTAAYTWIRNNVSAPQTNDVRFAAQIWDGDGKTPLWWVQEDVAGQTDGLTLSVYEGYLLNRTDLDTPFRLMGFRMDAAGKPMLKWAGDGPPHGVVEVLTKDDLLSTDLPWTLVPAEALVFENGTMTWTGGDVQGDIRFYRVRVRE